MAQVEVTYDTSFNTWNVMLGKQCLYYNENVIKVEEWLEHNKENYFE